MKINLNKINNILFNFLRSEKLKLYQHILSFIIIPININQNIMTLNNFTNLFFTSTYVKVHPYVDLVQRYNANQTKEFETIYGVVTIKEGKQYESNFPESLYKSLVKNQEAVTKN